MATRRLPVIQEPTGEDAEAAARPPWRWVLVGAGLLLTFWFPQVMVVAMGVRALSRAASAMAALLLLTFGLSALASGYLTARFGPRTRPRHAVLAGLTAAGVLVLLALLGGALPDWLALFGALFALSALGAAGCGLGALLARRKAAPR